VLEPGSTVLRDMIKIYEEKQSPVIAVEEVPKDESRGMVS